MVNKAAKLIHVTAPHVDPPPEGNRLGIDARAQPAPEQRDERDAAGAGIVEACGFRSAWIYRRHRQILGNVAERMCVAYGEIIQSALHACIPANRKVRLIPVNVKRATVDATDAEPFIARFARRKRHRQIVLACLRSARPRV